MRYARRRDANDQTITDALRQAGFTVDDFGMAGYVPDKLVSRDGWVCWVEVKVKGGRLTQTQKRFREVFEPRGEFYIARNPVEAVAELTRRAKSVSSAGPSNAR